MAEKIESKTLVAVQQQRSIPQRVQLTTDFSTIEHRPNSHWQCFVNKRKLEIKHSRLKSFNILPLEIPRMVCQE